MPTYSRAERLAAIQAAGFKNPMTALSVSLAEFGENRDINVQSQADYVFQPGQHPDYPNGGQERSFGAWQIHLPSHPDVPQSCAMDLTCSTQKAFQISNGGTDFSAWSAYNNGSYKTFLGELVAPLHAIATPPPTTSGDSGGGRAGQPAPSAAPAAPADCRIFNEIDIARATLSQMRGFTAADIARDLGVTGECLGFNLTGAIANAQRVIDMPLPAVKGVAEIITGTAQPGDDLGTKVNELGKKLDATGKGLSDVGSAIHSIQDSFRAENLWRAAFLVVGAAAIVFGFRMYFHNSDSGEPDTQSATLQPADSTAAKREPPSVGGREAIQS